MSAPREKIHAVAFTLSDLQALRLAVDRALDKIPTREGVLYDRWNRLLPELDHKIESCAQSESKTPLSPFRIATDADVAAGRVRR